MRGAAEIAISLMWLFVIGAVIWSFATGTIRLRDDGGRIRAFPAATLAILVLTCSGFVLSLLVA